MDDLAGSVANPEVLRGEPPADFCALQIGVQALGELLVFARVTE